MCAKVDLEVIWGGGGVVWGTENPRRVWPVDGGGWQPQVGGDDPKKAHACANIENVDEILLKIRVAT